MNFVKQFKCDVPLQERMHGFMVVQRTCAGARFGAFQFAPKNHRTATYFFFSKKEAAHYKEHEIIVGFKALRSIIVEGIIYKSPRDPKRRYIVPVNDAFDDERAWSPQQEFMFCVFESIIETCVKNKIQKLEESYPNRTWNGFSFDENLIRAIECISKCNVEQLIDMSLSISD